MLIVPNICTRLLIFNKKINSLKDNLMLTPKIELKNVTKTKNGNKILERIDITFCRGGLYVIYGQSGSGKSTLLRLLNRLDDPTEGIINFEGTDIRNIPVIDLRKRIGMVFQIPVIFDGTVRDNLYTPYNLGVTQSKPSDEEMKNKLTIAGLSSSIMNNPAENLSVGEKQRLTIARALINNPEVLLLDEPTSALDEQNSLTVLNSIKSLNKNLGLTVIMVTHNKDHLAITEGNKITIENGVAKIGDH